MMLPTMISLIVALICAMNTVADPARTLSGITEV